MLDYQILSKKVLSNDGSTRVVRVDVYAPAIAKSVEPGQFILFMLSASGERVPLTVVGSDKDRGFITLIFQEAGYSTKMFGSLEVGSCLFSLAGPLGHPTPIKNYGKVAIVGGGVGIAEVLPVARALKEAGNLIISILGARTKELLILREEMAAASDKLILVTDDGTLGEKGFVTDALGRLLKEESGIEFIYCVGPVPMMKAVSAVTLPYKIKTIVCLNAIMLDGTGMCGCCRVTDGGKTKFCCVDGPEFDGHTVDFGEDAPAKRFIDREKESLRKMDDSVK